MSTSAHCQAAEPKRGIRGIESRAEWRTPRAAWIGEPARIGWRRGQHTCAAEEPRAGANELRERGGRAVGGACGGRRGGERVELVRGLVGERRIDHAGDEQARDRARERRHRRRRADTARRSRARPVISVDPLQKRERGAADRAARGTGALERAS